MSNVELKKLWKRIGDVPIVKGIDLHLNDGEFVVMVGPSGCGKSTILRMLAGLEDVTDGAIFIDDQDITSVPPGRRAVSMVFQDYALYPHMSVYENLAFGLRMQKLSEEEIGKRVAEAARMLGLKDYLERKPKELSGGQRQRVAMGRAVVKNSKLFLFDEPLSNLDAKLRGVMRGEIKRFHQKNKTTTLYVTHDELEAMTLADRLVVINQGVIEQEGHPLEVFDCPKNIFVARFIGSPEINIIDVDIHEKGEDVFVGLSELNMLLKLPKEKQEMCRGHKKVKLGLRPSDIYISQDNHLEHWTIETKVEMVEVLGKNAYITFSYGDEQSCTGEVMGRSLPRIGESVKVVLNLDHAHFFDWGTGENLNG